MKNILSYLNKLGLEDHTDDTQASLTSGSAEQSEAVVAAVATDPEVQQTESAITQVIEEKIGGTVAVDPITGVAGEVAVGDAAPAADETPATGESEPGSEPGADEGAAASEFPDDSQSDAGTEGTDIGSGVDGIDAGTDTGATDLGSALPENNEVVAEEPAVAESAVVEETPASTDEPESEDGLVDAPEGGAESGEAEGTQEETQAETEGGESQAEDGAPIEEAETTSEEVASTDETETSDGEQTDAGTEGTGVGGGDGTADIDDEDDEDIDIDVPDVDEDVDEDDIEDAEEEAEVAEAADDELDDVILDTSKSVDELEEEEVAVEEFIGVLQHGIKTQRFNAQTIALSQSKLLKLSSMVGRDSPCIPSMEDYTKSNMSEYYENSLESFTGFLKKLKGKRDQLLDKFASSMNEKMHLKAVDKRVTAINAKLDAEILRVKDLEFVSHEIRLPMILRGTKGPIELVTNQVKWLGEIAATFKSDKVFLEGLAKLLGDAVGETDAVKANAIVNRAVKLPLPGNTYPKGLFTKNPDFDMVYRKSDATKSGSIVDDMKNLGDRAIPVLKREYVTVASGKESFTPRKQDLVKMLQLAKLLVGLSRGTAGASGKGLVNSIGTVNEAKSVRNQTDKKAGAPEDVKRANKALSGLVDSFWDSALNSLHNYENFQEHTAALASQLVKTVAKAKAGKKPEAK